MLLKQQIEQGKLFIGESGGAIVCAPTISYVEKMDKIPEDYSQNDYSGLNLIDFYVLPHYLTAPFKKSTALILEEFADIGLEPINNSQAIIIEGNSKKVITFGIQPYTESET